MNLSELEQSVIRAALDVANDYAESQRRRNFVIDLELDAALLRLVSACDKLEAKLREQVEEDKQ